MRGMAVKRCISPSVFFFGGGGFFSPSIKRSACIQHRRCHNVLRADVPLPPQVLHVADAASLPHTCTSTPLLWMLMAVCADNASTSCISPPSSHLPPPTHLYFSLFLCLLFLSLVHSSHLFVRLCGGVELDAGQLHHVPSFTLQGSIAALELMDPKMDSGMKKDASYAQIKTLEFSAPFRKKTT